MKIYNYDPEKVRNVGIGIVVQIFVSTSRNVYLFLTISAHFFNFKKKKVFYLSFFQKKRYTYELSSYFHKVFFKKGKKKKIYFSNDLTLSFVWTDSFHLACIMYYIQLHFMMLRFVLYGTKYQFQFCPHE